MQTKQTILLVAGFLGLLLVWNGVLWYVNRVHPEYQKELVAMQINNQPASPNASTPTQNPTPSTGSTGGGGSATMSAAPAVALAPTTNPATIATLGSNTEKDSKYAMQVVISAEGAAVERVVLNHFHQKVREPNLYTFEEPYADHPETAPLATRKVTINGIDVDSMAPWTLVSSSPSSATFSTTILRDKQPLALLTKTFTLPTIPDSATTSQGYELGVSYAVKNLSAQPIEVQTVTNGPTIPPKEVERGTDRQVLVGYNGGSAITVSQHPIEEFRKDKTSEDLTTQKDQPAAWAGAASVYFNALVLPTAAPGGSAAGYTIHADNIEPTTDTPTDVAMTFTSAKSTITPGASLEMPLAVFLGPKERNLLETPYYSSFPRQFNGTLVITSGFCGICTFPFLINALVWMLSCFHFVVRDWGLSIICLVILVRVVLHPITKKSQVQMAKMSKMGPEIERLKAKYADDKDGLNKAMMQYYKDEGPAQILGCLPMFLQTPIWIALWSALQSTFELRHSPFLAFGRVHLTWIADLSNPDSLFSFTPIHIFGFEVSSFNLLPILLGVVFYFQQKFTPRPAAATDEQRQQQAMMTWMSTLMFPFFLYKAPAGLTLYILTSTTMGIIEGKIIRDHIKQREEAEKAGRVFVDAKPTRGARRKDSNKKDSAPAKKGGIMGWLADLQAKAEEIRRQAEKGK